MREDPITLCRQGQISAPVALARLLLAGETAETIAARLKDGADVPDLAALLHGRGAALSRLARAAAEADHSRLDSVSVIAAFFDRAVAASPEAAVAFYSLGDPAILDAATEELVAWLAAQGLVGAASDVLDLGCGIGRVAAALAGRCRSVQGVDVSAAMVAEARRRHPGLAFAQVSGRDLRELSDRQFDLVLAVDSFPYIVAAGAEVVRAHLAGIAGMLRPGGALAIFNLSYRGDPCADRTDAASWAGEYGFAVKVAGETPFCLWDGQTYVLRRT